jgi:hypothetical protein
MSDITLRSTEGLLLVVVLVSYVLAFVIRRLRRRRPGFRIGRPVIVGFGVRLLAVAAINATSVQAELRGGDESTFLAFAHSLATTPIGRGFLPHGPYQLQTIVFAVQIKLADLSPTALRVTQIGIAMVGLVLIVAAVYDLAGARASRLAAWLLMLEPASIFFNSELHKEPLMELATGLVVLGGTKIWQRLDLTGLFLCALGGVIAIETRSYAGWFLVSAAVLLTLHAALRRLDRPLRAMPIVYAVALIVFLATPTLLSVTSRASLQRLQQSQAFTTGSQAASATGGPNSDNLAFERVDFSTRGAVIRNLPQRMFDLVARPYPWQLQDTSQRLGGLGSLVALAIFGLLLVYAWRSRGQILTRTAPILYPLLFLLIAYSLSAGNAGTGFRYRTHLVVLAIAMVVILREHLLRPRTITADVSSLAAAPTGAAPESPEPVDERALTPTRGGSGG